MIGWIELLENMPRNKVTIGEVADYLLANGALVAPMPMADWLRDELSGHIDKRCFEEL